MLATDGHGIPIGFVIGGAHEAEVCLAQPTLATIRVQTGHGRARTRPKELVADRAYDSGPLRRALRRRGMKVCIPPKKRPKHWRAKKGRPVTYDKASYKKRWHVERTFAWLGNYRRLLVRWEYHKDVYQAFFTFALMLICINKLLK
jgi:transposase